MLSALQGMDAGFLLMLQNARTDWLDPLAAGYTSLGNAGVIWIAISLAMLCHRSTRPAGMLALCAEAGTAEEYLAGVEDLLAPAGRVERIAEGQMDAFSAVAGCGPAFVYPFIEALADGCVKNGLPRQMAYRMAAQAVLGSAKMVLETGKHPGELKDMVCSPGGTTIEGVAALEEGGFRSSIIKACDANYEKNKRLK